MSVALPGKVGAEQSYGGLTVKFGRKDTLVEGCELCTSSARYTLSVAGYPLTTARVRQGGNRAWFCRKHTLEMVEAYVSAVSEREEQ